MWLLFLPQALLRQPRRGGKAGRNLTAQRFNALVKGDWGKLITLWERDKIISEEARRWQRNKTTISNEEKIDKKTRNVVGLIAQGQVSKAANRINSFGVADITEGVVMDQVRSKYPARGRPLLEAVSWGKPVENLRSLRESLLHLERGKSPGTGGLESEYLIILAEMLTDVQIDLFESFGMKYLTGELPSWFTKYGSVL